MNLKNKKVWWGIGIAVLFLIVFTSIKVQNTPSDFLPPISDFVSSVRQTSGTTEYPLVESNEMAVEKFASAPSLSLTDDLVVFDTAGATAAEVDQKIIKTGYLNLEVDSVDETTSTVMALAIGKNGFIQESSAFEREDGTKYGTITARVPVIEFENTVTEIKGLAVAINSESTSGQDVTERYTDLEARLRNAEAQETEYLEILKKADSVTDILAVQSYLGQVREQIESLQGQIKYLENQTSYSTISVSLSEEPTLKIPSKEFRPWTTVKEAAQALVTLFQNLIIYGIWIVVLAGGLLLPLVIIGLIIYWLIKRKLKNKKTRR